VRQPPNPLLAGVYEFIAGASDNEEIDSSFCGLLSEAGPVLVKARFVVNGKRIDGGKAYKIKWAERQCIS
jgi:hypothetical protein